MKADETLADGHESGMSDGPQNGPERAAIDEYSSPPVLQGALLGEDEPIEPDEGPAGHRSVFAAAPPFVLPEDPEEARDVALAALVETRREADEYLETMQRVAAEFGNYRKRVERDHADIVVRATQRVVERLLPALDSFDAALSYEPQTPAEEKILDGMRGTHGQVLDILASEGLEAVPAVGHVFDPSVHEAVAGPADGGDDLVVAQELRRGYVLQQRLIRPSLVVVESSDSEDGPERS